MNFGCQQELASRLTQQRHLQEQLQQQQSSLQQSQRQLYAAVQHMDQLQQQAHQQAVKAYKTAVQSSCERLTELKERYFHCTPVGASQNSRHAGSNAIKLQRENIVSAYTDFQQRRGNTVIESISNSHATGISSPSSSLRRGTWAGSPQGTLQQPLLQLTSRLDSPSRAITSNSRFQDSRRSMIAPVSRTSSATIQKSATPSPPSHAKQTGDVSDATALQIETAASSVPLQAREQTAAEAQSTDTALDFSGWMIAEVQPEASWMLPYMEQLMQLEACLLNALTEFLTQGPTASDEEESGRASRKKQSAAVRQQTWPKSAEGCQQTAEDTMGTAILP